MARNEQVSACGIIIIIIIIIISINTSIKGLAWFGPRPISKMCGAMTSSATASKKESV